MFFSARFIPSIIEEISLLMATATQAGSNVKIFMLSVTLAMLVTPALAESHAISDSVEAKEEIEVIEVESLVSYSSDQAARGKKYYEKWWTGT